ncbi:uncharacterized protein [Paramisgurnus dabryanus]|uniref:uncharacterized protein isoform X1 n=1 Tax=Paramisgurnus dabryanus TaxID=90735 RepID=UPI0031F346E0
MMGGVNVILLVLLVWTFTAVSEANIDITIKCENVTAHVGDEITFTCTVSYPSYTCCTEMYKFMNITADKGQTICKEEFRNDSCIQLSRFSSPYTADKPMTTKLQFFLQANCGHETTYFTMHIAEAVKDDTAGDLNRFTGEGFGESTKETSSQTAVIISVMCLIIIIMGLIYKKKLNFINTCGFQKDYNMDVHEKILSNCSDRETVDINM